MSRDLYGAFDQLRFPKTGAEIKRLQEREEAAAKIIEDIGVDSPVDALINVKELLERTHSSSKAPSEAKNRLQHVVGKIEKERKELAQLKAVERNLPESETFNLSFTSLRYFDF